MADYSHVPLSKKLSIKEGFTVCILNAPENFLTELYSLPPAVEIIYELDEKQDLILLFVTMQEEYFSKFDKLAAVLPPDGTLWVAWPKKSSNVCTNLDFDIIQSFGLENGMVDNKSCSINETYSGLKFVFRLKDREKNAFKK